MFLYNGHQYMPGSSGCSVYPTTVCKAWHSHPAHRKRNIFILYSARAKLGTLILQSGGNMAQLAHDRRMISKILRRWTKTKRVGPIRPSRLVTWYLEYWIGGRTGHHHANCYSPEISKLVGLRRLYSLKWISSWFEMNLKCMVVISKAGKR